MATKPSEAAITSDEMQMAEFNSEYLGVSHFQLMEAVGANISREIATRTATKPNPRIHIISGPGKNGGDGFAVARHLASQGLKVRVTLVGRPNDVKDEAAKQQLNTIIQMNDSIQFESLSDSSQLRPVEADIILDAILGYGVQGDLRQPLLGAVRIINRSRGYKIALDLPSGLDSDPGEHLNLKDLPELERWMTSSDAIVLGPGIGLHEETVDVVKKLITQTGELKKPLVLDADALKIFGRSRRRLNSPAVLTPHAGEFAQVLQRKISLEISLQQEATTQLAKETGATVVLKGNVDIIADPTRLKLNKTGNPYMTVGGTGDLLTRIIGALLAQHIEPFRAASADAFLNGLAGDMLMKERGPTVTPLALVDFIPQAIKYCIDGPPYPKIRN